MLQLNFLNQRHLIKPMTCVKSNCLTLIILLAASFQAFAINTILIPPAPRVASSSYLLQDFDSGKILAEKNIDQKLPPASLTKLMTVYVIFNELKNGHLHLDETVMVSKKAWQTPGSRMFIEVNKQIKISDLLQGVIIQSGNDACVALAEHVAGNEATFAQMMNQHAARLGMNNTNFVNSMGLPHQDHYTTVRDLAILTRALIKEFPEYYRWFSVKEFTFNKITQPNRNKLLWRDESVDGVKTGHTEEAGYCLIASAKRNDMRLISVVMGTNSENARANESQSLLNYGFRFFETHKLYSANESLKEAKAWKGQDENLTLGLSQDLFVTIPRRHYKDLKASISVDKKIIAPIKAGEVHGTVKVTLADTLITSEELIALKEVKKGGVFKQLYDEALMLIK